MVRLEWKDTTPFYVAAFCADCGGGMFLAAVPYLAMRVGADSLDLGTMNAVRSLSLAVACVTLPLLLRRANRATLTGLAAPLLAFSILFAGASSRLAHLYVTGVGWEIGAALFWPALYGWLGDTLPAERLPRATSAVNLSWATGFMVGNLVGGRLFLVGPLWPCIAASVMPVIGCGVLMLAPFDHARPTPVPASRRRPGARRELAAAWVGNIAISILFGLMYGVFPKLGETLGIRADAFGSLMFIMGVGRISVFMRGLFGCRWAHDWRVAAGAQAAAAAMVATVTWCGRGWLAVVFPVVGLSLGVTYYRGLFASLADVGARSWKSGAHEASLVVGVLIGSLAGGWAAEAFGLRSPYAPVAVVVALLAAAQALLGLSARRAANGPLPQPAERK